MNVPTVKLYTLAGAEIYLEGESLLKNSLASFKYTYTEEKGKGDSGILTMAFATINFDLKRFEPGNMFGVRWGFLNSLGPTRQIAIADFDAKYSIAGWMITLKFVSAAEYKSKGSIKAGTMKENILDRMGNDVAFTWEFKDKRGSTIVGEFVPNKNDFRMAVGQKFSIPMKRMAIEGPEEIKMTRKEQLDAMTEDEQIAAWNEAIKNKKHFSKRTQHEWAVFIRRSTVTLGETFLKFTQYVQDMVNTGYVTGARDSAITNRVPDRTAKGLFRIRPGRDLIHLAISKADAATGASAHTTAAVDPTDKLITSEETEITKIQMGAFGTEGFLGPDYEYILMKGEQEAWGVFGDSTMIQLDKEVWDRALLAYQKQDVLKGVLLEEGEKASVLQEIAATKDRIPHEQTDPIGNPNTRQKDVVEQSQLYPNYLGAEERLTEEDVSGYIEFKSCGSPSELANMVINAEKEELFHSLKAVLKLEGLPELESNHTFYLTNVSPNINGKYFNEKTEHDVTRGGYTMTVTSYKVDYDEVQRKETLKQSLEELETARTLKYLTPITEKINDVLDWTELKTARNAYHWGTYDPYPIDSLKVVPAKEDANKILNPSSTTNPEGPRIENLKTLLDPIE